MRSVPDCLGVGLEQAEQRLGEAGLSVVLEDITPARAPAGYQDLRVVRQRSIDEQTVQLTVAAFMCGPSPEPVHIELTEAPESGVYMLEMVLRERLAICVGSLGEIVFEAGEYVYVGSAKKCLEARVGRHMRGEKKLKWHVDYLSSRVRATRAFVWPWSEGLECRLAGELAKGGSIVEGFGASDCDCKGHLTRLRGGSSEWWRRLSRVPPPSYVISSPEKDRS